MSRKILIIFIMAMILLFSSTSYAYTSPQEFLYLSAESAILIDAESGDVLYEKNPNKIMYPASTTKIMTAILTLENTRLSDKIIIDKDTPFTEGSRIYVIEGEEFTVEELLHALLVQSANDAAVAFAKHISGSVEEFALLMNKRAKELGAKNTNFVNPNGLPDENHVTTAYDLAMISKYAMTLPEFREIVKTVRYQISPTNKQSEIRYLKNTNRLLWGVGSRNRIQYNGKWIDIKYDIVDGIKTGYTLAAQQCLVASGQKDGRRLISVVLKSKGTDVYLDTRKLLDFGFDNFRNFEIVNSGRVIEKVKIPNGKEEELDLITQQRITKTIHNDIQLDDIKSKIYINEDIKAPIFKGQVLGKITYTLNEKIIGESNLIAKNSVEEKTINKIIKRAKNPKNLSLLKITFFIVFLYIIWRSIVTYKRLKSRRYRL